MIELAAMLLGAILGRSETSTEPPAEFAPEPSRSPDVPVIPGVVWVMHFEDGAKIGRVLTTEAWDELMIPMWKEQTSDSLKIPIPIDLPSQNKELPGQMFFYVDSSGTPKGAIIASHSHANERGDYKVRDAGGEGLGRIFGDARRRLIAFIFDALLPNDLMPILADASNRLSVPDIYSDEMFDTLTFFDIFSKRGIPPIAERDLDDWLDANGDFSGQQLPQAEPYILLDQQTPLSASTEKFLLWACPELSQ